MLSPSKQTFILYLPLLCTISCYSAKTKEDSADSKRDANHVVDLETIDKPPKNKDAQTATRSDSAQSIIKDAKIDAPVDSDTRPTPIPMNHRPVAEVCDDIRELPEPEPMVVYDGVECTVHADCDQGSNGRCVLNRDWPSCSYDVCFKDSDCDGSVCLCGGNAANRCMAGNCQIDADCGPNGYCSPSFGDCGAYSGVVAYYCHTPEDECIDDADCGGVEGSWGPYCAFNVVAGRWMCGDAHCVG